MSRIQAGRYAHKRGFDPEGIIRLGSSRKQGGFGAELPYFRLDDAPKVAKVHGEKPNSLPVMLPDNDPETVFEDKYELWRGSKKEGVKGVLLCYGDGQTAYRITDEDDPFRREAIPCPTPDGCAYAWEHTSQKARRDGCSACGAVGRLRVICYRVNILEVYEVRTGSWNALQGVANKLEDLLAHPMFGRLVGVPLIMERVPKPNRFGKTNYPVRVVIPTWTELEAECTWLRGVIGKVNAVTFQLPQPQARPMLPHQAGVPDELVHEAQLAGAPSTPAPAAAPAPAAVEPTIEDPPEGEEEPREVEAEVLCDTCHKPWPPPEFVPSAHPDACPDCGRPPEDLEEEEPPAEEPAKDMPASRPGANAGTTKERTRQAGEGMANLIAEKRRKEAEQKEAAIAARKDRASPGGKPSTLFQF